MSGLGFSSGLLRDSEMHVSKFHITWFSFYTGNAVNVFFSVCVVYVCKKARTKIQPHTKCNDSNKTTRTFLVEKFVRQQISTTTKYKNQ